MNFIRKKRKNRTGAAAVEFALIFPITISFFFSSLLFVQAFQIRDAAESAAYDGARQGMLFGATDQEVKHAVRRSLTAMRIKGGRIAVTGLDDKSRNVTIQVQIPIGKNLLAAAPFIPKNWACNSQVTLKRETN